MKVDLHVHTSERSNCATRSEDSQIQAAIQAGLDGIAITDHDRLVPAAHLQALNARYAPFKIFSGIEVSAGLIHWGVVGLHDPALESLDWNYQDLIPYVQERGGFIFLAHPFRYRPELEADIAAHRPDGIELQSINTPASRKADIAELAERLDLVALRNSDGHNAGGVGSYHNALPCVAADDRQLVAALYQMKPSRLRADQKQTGAAQTV